MCEHVFLFTQHSRICTNCGVEERRLTMDVYNANSAPMSKGYERSVRFRQKIDKLLFLRNPPPATCLLWDFLATQKMKSPLDVRNALRRYTGKQKYYDSIRIFTRTFTPFRVKLRQDVLYLDTQLQRLFSCVLRNWNRCPSPHPYCVSGRAISYALRAHPRHS